MSRAELRRLFQTLRNEGVAYVGIAGGEPLVRSDFLEIMSDLAASDLRCMLLTNGVLLDKKMMEALAALGVVDAVRMSVEFPENSGSVKLSSGNYHPAKMTLEKVAQCKKAGLTVGVNMTLFPENIQFVEEMALQCRNAGAAFFRAVPVFPVGRYAQQALPETFLATCIASLLNVHRSMAGDEGTSGNRVVLKNFTCGCGAGSTLFTVDADGMMSGCALVAASRHAVQWDCDTLAKVLATLRNKTTRLQRTIMNNRNGRCGDCEHRLWCRGGCIAEWDSRGRPHGQPCCYVDAVATVNKSRRNDRGVAEVLAALSEKIGNARLFNVQTPCLRALPIWTVRFD